MKHSTKIFTVFCCALLFASLVQAQIFENNYVWHAQSHAAWKVQPNAPQGYVIAGDKYFASPNTSIYMTGFDEFGQEQWTRTHASGFTSLQSFWKSFTVSSSPIKYFVVSAGEQSGHKAYALLTNATGNKYWDRASVLPMGIEFGGVTVASNGGWVASGSTSNGNFAAVKFDEYGVIEWANEYPVPGFGWSISQTAGGVGYVLAGDRKIVRISHLGVYQGSTTINLGNAPAPDGSAYSYGEFEEITPLPDYSGFIVTGSTFSNAFSGVYTARVTYSGSVVWAKINDQVSTSGTGTPVAWINNAIINDDTEIVTSWRRGPIATGGSMFYQRMNLSGTNIGAIRGLNNSIGIREGFMIKPHGKFVIGGSRINLASAYSYVNAVLPATGEIDTRASEPFAEANELTRVQTNTLNSRPIFDYPASRTFASELRVFPNPASGMINVGGKLEPGALLRVVSMSGKVVLEREIQPGDTLLQLDLTSVGKGMYGVEMVGQSGITTRKVVVE